MFIRCSEKLEAIEIDLQNLFKNKLSFVLLLQKMFLPLHPHSEIMNVFRLKRQAIKNSSFNALGIVFRFGYLLSVDFFSLDSF